MPTMQEVADGREPCPCMDTRSGSFVAGLISLALSLFGVGIAISVGTLAFGAKSTCRRWFFGSVSVSMASLEFLGVAFALLLLRGMCMNRRHFLLPYLIGGAFENIVLVIIMSILSRTMSTYALSMVPIIGLKIYLVATVWCHFLNLRASQINVTGAVLMPNAEIDPQVPPPGLIA